MANPVSTPSGISGLYVRSIGSPEPMSELHRRRAGTREEVRLDVDGLYPQMVISGAIRSKFAVETNWIAKLAPTGTNSWRGVIEYKNGDIAAFPYTHVLVSVTAAPPTSHTLTLTLGGGALEWEEDVSVTRTFGFRSPAFHDVEFEFDTVDGAHPVLSIETHAHPNHPTTVASETLSIAEIYERAGFSVSMSGGNNVIPLSGAGIDEVWSDTEMHDAMQASWSHFANRPAWALWVFFAALHEQGESLGGVMFDDIGPNHRQGTAIFTESFIKVPPANDPAPEAWIARMRFWTAVHEMGHAFNLAHAWQKSHPPQYGKSWVPLVNDPEARSFMNYPYNVRGGQTAFFANFEFRFTDEELLFMRHAPSRFVQMGNADWFDDHGFRHASVSPEPSLTFTLRVNRERPIFEFLEPVVVELKLTNRTNEPRLVDEKVLADVGALTMIIKRQNQPARQWHPFARACIKPKSRVLLPGESMYESIFVGVGTNGWSLSEPGRYLLQASLPYEGEDIVSNALDLRILPPRGYDEEQLAQDFFTDEVGRTLAFDGTRELVHANDVLREVSARLPDRTVAVHSDIAIGMPLRKPGKVLDATSFGRVMRHTAADLGEAQGVIDKALFAQPEVSATTLGHIDYGFYAESLAEWLLAGGDAEEASKILSKAADVLAERKVKREVVEDLRMKATLPGKVKEPNGAAKAQVRASKSETRPRYFR
jgi:hypothetical protein